MSHQLVAAGMMQKWVTCVSIQSLNKYFLSTYCVQDSGASLRYANHKAKT